MHFFLVKSRKEKLFIQGFYKLMVGLPFFKNQAKIEINSKFEK